MAQLVEHHLAKVRVAGSNPVVRSIRIVSRAPVLRRLGSIAAALVLAASLLVACGGESRYDVVVAAASDTRDAFAEIAALANAEFGVDVGFVFGSSGLLREQVIAGAPYDVYVSANDAYVDDVVRAGFGVPESRREFAEGRLAVISADGIGLPGEVSELGASSRLVIANPSHAPYGVAAREALQRLGLWSALEQRVVLADNVADAVRVVRAGEADAGIIALSLVLDGPHLLVDDALHDPIRQSLVITTHGSNNPAARTFIEVLGSAEGRAILRRYGFTVKS